MKSLQEWFEEYSQNHQNVVNIKIHYICVPIIYFSIMGILMSIPSQGIANIIPGDNPVFSNLGSLALIFIAIFYSSLSTSMTLKMVAFTLFCMLGNYFLGLHLNLFLFSLVLFAMGWVGQFYGHQVEGKKPSFLKDLQFLLIGPAWVVHKLFSKDKN